MHTAEFAYSSFINNSTTSKIPFDSIHYLLPLELIDLLVLCLDLFL